MRILVLHGPNLNLLGQREVALYGTATLLDVERILAPIAAELGVALEFRQSNHEGQLIDWIQQAPTSFQGILLNPGGYGHTSVALLDALLSVALPTVEVHLTNLARREEFRQVALSARAAIGRVEGFGVDSYRLGLLGLVNALQSNGR